MDRTEELRRHRISETQKRRWAERKHEQAELDALVDRLERAVYVAGQKAAELAREAQELMAENRELKSRIKGLHATIAELRDPTPPAKARVNAARTDRRTRVRVDGRMRPTVIE
jgi:predicted  nucleic acid-binding Zn-ribbon protein